MSQNPYGGMGGGPNRPMGMMGPGGMNNPSGSVMGGSAGMMGTGGAAGGMMGSGAGSGMMGGTGGGGMGGGFNTGSAQMGMGGRGMVGNMGGGQFHGGPGGGGPGLRMPTGPQGGRLPTPTSSPGGPNLMGGSAVSTNNSTVSGNLSTTSTVASNSTATTAANAGNPLSNASGNEGDQSGGSQGGGANAGPPGSNQGGANGQGGGDAGAAQQQQPKEYPMSALCRIGQETVEEIISRTQEVFSILKTLQPPVGQFTPQNQQSDRNTLERQARLQEVLKNVGRLFKRVRVCWEKCEESSATLEYSPIHALIPLKEESDSYKNELEKKRGEAYKSALDEHNELIQQIVLKNRHLKEIIDQMRNIIWEINTMLVMRQQSPSELGLLGGGDSGPHSSSRQWPPNAGPTQVM